MAAPTPIEGLTPKQALFVIEYLKDLNGTQAAIRAGYSAETAKEMASENLTKPYIQKAVKKQMDARAGRTLITADLVLNEMRKLATFDARNLYTEKGEAIPLEDLDDETAASVVGLEVLEQFERDEDGVPRKVGEVKKWKLADKTANLAGLARHLGLGGERLVIVNDASEIAAVLEDWTELCLSEPEANRDAFLRHAAHLKTALSRKSQT